MLYKNSFAARVALLTLLLAVLPLGETILWAQSSPKGTAADEAVYFVGLSLDELVTRFGTPQTVYAARGKEQWQDDVVFVYREGEFFIHKDRVWQVALKSACGVVAGDAKPAVLLTLGAQAVDRGDYILSPVAAGTVWPLMLRVNFNTAGKVQTVYIYRSDF